MLAPGVVGQGAADGDMLADYKSKDAPLTKPVSCDSSMGYSTDLENSSAEGASSSTSPSSSAKENCSSFASQQQQEVTRSVGMKCFLEGQTHSTRRKKKRKNKTGYKTRR